MLPWLFQELLRSLYRQGAELSAVPQQKNERLRGCQAGLLLSNQQQGWLWPLLCRWRCAALLSLPLHSGGRRYPEGGYLQGLRGCIYSSQEDHPIGLSSLLSAWWGLIRKVLRLIPEKQTGLMYRLGLPEMKLRQALP